MRVICDFFESSSGNGVLVPNAFPAATNWLSLLMNWSLSGGQVQGMRTLLMPRQVPLFDLSWPGVTPNWGTRFGFTDVLVEEVAFEAPVAGGPEAVDVPFEEPRWGRAVADVRRARRVRAVMNFIVGDVLVVKLRNRKNDQGENRTDQLSIKILNKGVNES